MQAAIIENGIVTNIIVTDSLSAIAGVTLVDATGARIGSAWDGSGFTDPVVKPDVPQSVSRFQALAALSIAGLLDKAQAAATASTDPLVALAWNNAQTFDRDSNTVATLGPALGLTDEQIDQLFIQAAQITA